MRHQKIRRHCVTMPIELRTQIDQRAKFRTNCGIDRPDAEEPVPPHSIERGSETVDDPSPVQGSGRTAIAVRGLLSQTTGFL